LPTFIPSIVYSTLNSCISISICSACYPNNGTHLPTQDLQ